MHKLLETPVILQKDQFAQLKQLESERQRIESQRASVAKQMANIVIHMKVKKVRSREISDKMKALKVEGKLLKEAIKSLQVESICPFCPLLIDVINNLCISGNPTIPLPLQLYTVKSQYWLHKARASHED